MTEESRAEYWKAEHNAANEEIERLRARIAELKLTLASAYGQWDVADADRQALKARVAELEAQLRASAEPWMIQNALLDTATRDRNRYREALGYVEPILNEAIDLLSWAKHDLYKAGNAEYLDKIVCTQHEGEDALNRIRQLI